MAGFYHLVSPEVFLVVIPSWVPFKNELILLTGVLEIILAALLLNPGSRKRSAELIAFYFLLLLPLHVYVALNDIPMAGVDHPVVLWGRVLFQFILIWWALSLRKSTAPKPPESLRQS